MTGRADDDADPPAPVFRVDRGPADDVVELGAPPPSASGRRTRTVLVAAAAVLAAVGAASWWWSVDEAEDAGLTRDLPGSGRLVVQVGDDEEVDVRVDVDGRTRCQGVSRLEVTGRSLCGAGGVVAVVVPSTCRVRFETTAAPPVEAARLDVPGTDLAIAAAVVAARGVTPGVRPVVVDDAGGRRLLSDLVGRGSDAGAACG